jgi:hypothetical protein
MKNLLTERELRVDRDELFAAMGYPSSSSVSEPVLRVCEAQLSRLEALARPWGSWLEIGIEEVGRGIVRLEGGRELDSARLASILRHARSLCVVVVTLGSRIGAEIRRLMEEAATLDAWALDAASSAATNDLLRQLVEQICTGALARQRGTTIRYGPGYTGWEIRDMAVLFSYLEREALPLQINEQLMLVPEKSLLNVVGITPSGRAAPEVLPCRVCDLEHCTARRAPCSAQPGSRSVGHRKRTTVSAQ